MKAPSRRLLSCFRDVLAIYLFCAGLCVVLSLRSGGGVADTSAAALPFGAGFSGGPQAGGAVSMTPNRETSVDVSSAHSPQKGSDKKDVVREKGKVKSYSRIFLWKDSGKRERRTMFSIDAALLKKELRTFGAPPGMRDPMMMRKRGFKVISRSNYMIGSQVRERVLTIVDYQKVFKRSLEYFPQFSKQLTDSAGIVRGNDPLYAFLAFVQHIRYKKPPLVYQGKYVNEFFTPLVCLYEQYGDCDSKSLLLADFLASVPGNNEEMGMVLVRGRGLAHAMLAVKRRVMPGMTALFLMGKGYYIVVETTRTGWAPGFVDRRLTGAIKAGMFQFEELKQ